jgi:hypothetical protein
MNQLLSQTHREGYQLFTQKETKLLPCIRNLIEWTCVTTMPSEFSSTLASVGRCIIQNLSKKYFCLSNATISEGVRSMLTNFTELIHSWEASSCAAIQEFPNILFNPKVHYPVHKNPPLAPILSQINAVRTTSFYFSKINFNIILPPTPGSSYWCLSFWLSHQYSLCVPLLPI